jgi:hypothetical protein
MGKWCTSQETEQLGLPIARLYVAPVAAGGQTFVVEQVNGAWVVTGITGAVWMS